MKEWRCGQTLKAGVELAACIPFIFAMWTGEVFCSKVNYYNLPGGKSRGDFNIAEYEKSNVNYFTC